ncbi:MAG: nucleotidyltransferase family protein [Chitinophagaceae bacterium]|nr:MAG: nucleotidyltransferase family protein [Chitinophagaceae bacterium]
MKAIIFCAGLGTRFKPWTDQHPKALAVINGKSLLQRNVEYLQQAGIYDVVVNIHHFADQIEEAVNRSKGWGSRVVFSDERNEVLETGGGLLKAAPHLIEGDFVAINVDVLTNLPLNKMIAYHQSKGALATLAVSDRKTSRFFLFDENDRLCGWRNVSTGAEKISVTQQAYNQKAFSGVHIINPQLFRLITQQGKFSMVDVYLDVSARNTVLAFDHTGTNFIDVGKPESVAIAEAMFP